MKTKIPTGTLPFHEFLATLRNGSASLEAQEKWQEVIESVCSTQQTATLTIKLKLKPHINKKTGIVDTADVIDSIVATLPQVAGESIVFVTQDMRLTTDRSEQQNLFPEIKKANSRLVDVSHETGEIIDPQ